MNRSNHNTASIEKSSKPTISVVLSFKNEEDTIPELIRRLRNVFDKEYKNNFELIFVNDNSTDRSEEILMEAAKGHNDIKIINMSRTFGVSECALAGMEHASGEAVIYMDADLQDPPEVISELVKAWKSSDNIDVVHTVRLSRAGESHVKLWLTKQAYKILKFVSDVNLQIEAGDFKLLSRHAVNHVIRFKEKKPFLRGLVTWIGFNQTTIYYHREARYGGKNKFPVFGYKVIQNYLNSALISFSDLPLKLSFVTGALVSFGSLLALIYIVIQLFTSQTISWWPAILFIMLFLGGIQLITIGILGLYIYSIFIETKGRPSYIVKSTFGFENNPPSLAEGHHFIDREGL